MVYSDLAHLEADMGNYTIARIRGQEALDHLIKTSAIDLQAAVTSKLVWYCGLCKDYEAAVSYAIEAMRLATLIGDKNVLAWTSANIGWVHLRLGEPEKAKQSFHFALENKDCLMEFAGYRDLYEGLSLAYEALGDDKKAYEFSKLFAAAQHEVDEIQIAGQLKYQEIIQKESAEKTAEILRLKKRELANTASSLAAQTELLGSFRADLRKIVLRPDKYEPEEIIKQVRAKLKELPCEMIDFGKFEARLETKYPELTPQEIKVCMLLHVSLKSAAIGRLMCISERGVENHRFNIRRKLELKTEDSLTKFLQEL